MPMRAYRASSAFAGRHIQDNMWLWIGLAAVATAALAVGVWQQPRSNIWGHLVALTGMFAGTLVMMKSQEGFVAPVAEDDDDGYVPTPG
ncbi:hypothetical protein ACFQY5_07810 [Paeniroseomonas aquatica]|uniref:Uncharacterized protein n=1 Tax=Paeniroseomonas aquatica TaxID=373043 RepID=A0ABT8AC02_9PROT|nr:hypothetical protein [Paeniroseomonas aquatica]MDN3567086.1 hypothetical protein [Paeniroseomonas aquatica]